MLGPVTRSSANASSTYEQQGSTAAHHMSSPGPQETPKPDVHPSSSMTSTTEPIASPTPLTKAVVMGRLSNEDVDWVTRDLPGWQHYIYTVDLEPNITISPTGFRTPINKGREAMPYLTYIIDHYNKLSDVNVFIHAHRNGYPAAWHNDAKDYDAVTMLAELQLPFVQEQGYANLRCRAIPGCPDEIQPWREPFDQNRDTEHIYPDVYGIFFNQTFDQYRDEIAVVGTQCCAQFAVSREQIQKHSRSEYMRWRQYVIETEHSDAVIGRVLEYMWHIIFGRSAVHCEEVVKCWCDVFGRCDVRGFRFGGG
ncbi:hypothetical protein LTR62_003121 [Meristemomyces frigidus]|uniref:Uncharacterized protein n=1 Tax=Meristemomyces frigidus TaxID=1508187 RepID=A0AAN7YPZ5_9PEZI|nr:hypothetical protein LTR62_003121 [Meristemomyces frigidus]